MTARTVTDKCGTYAGYQAHRREGNESCAECRAAAADYAREYRTRPGVKEIERAETAARSRALWRLAKLHPAQFQILVDQELDR